MLSKIFGLILFTLLLAPEHLSAVTIPLSQIPLGKVVSVNGLKFIKIAENQYLAAEPFGTMQGWNSCASLPNPACMADGTCKTTSTASALYTQGPTLMDIRDGKRYEIRKFPDGKCWMVDNLAYGGGTDGNSDYCAGKSTSRIAESPSNTLASATNGLNPPNGSRNTLVGDCIDANAGGSSYCLASGAAAGLCGYFYNWAAAIQNANGYYGGNLSLSGTVQGVCPDGWHLPDGCLSDQEIYNLDVAVGGNGQSGYGHSYANFWQGNAAITAGPFKTVYAGSFMTTYYRQGPLSSSFIVESHFWTKAQLDNNNAYNLRLDGGGGFYRLLICGSTNGSDSYKKAGMPVRCIKN
jgi:uncharacterized protein (TIGR02145 family)